MPIPVFVDNDANLMALAEHQTNHQDCSAFVLLKASTGIGAGVVIGNHVFRGIDGGAGDIGHIRLHDRPDALCMCGSYGCLAAVASGRALAHDLTQLGLERSSGSDVRRLLAERQPDAIRLARDAGRRAGEVLVTVVTLLNPGVLTLAGDLSGVPFMTGGRELLYQRAMPRTTANLQGGGCGSAATSTTIEPFVRTSTSSRGSWTTICGRGSSRNCHPGPSRRLGLILQP